MRRTSFIIPVFVFAVLLLVNYSCAPAVSEKAESQIENTLKSVSLVKDTVSIDQTEFLASLERINEAIDSIGYPDAGYELWIVQSDTVTDFRFMVNGNWPNQEVYDEIHEHELYKSALEPEEELWNKLTTTLYCRFTRVR